MIVADNQTSADLSLSGKRWLQRTSDDRQTRGLAQALGIPEITARLLTIRGVNTDTAQRFLTPRLRDHLPDPFHLKDMDKAVDRLVAAIIQQQRICCYGDYDVDGATSTALMMQYFRAIGVKIEYYIPDRITEGYGPNTKAFQTLAERGVNVIITVDCGTTSFEPIATAQGLGVDVIVIDHHTAEPRLPDAYALVNPNRLDETSPCRTLAAVGVSFLLLIALTQRLRQKDFFKTRPEPNLMQFLDIVALGTVCDVMPLEGLNRTLVSQGLKILAQRQNIGLNALCEVGRLTTMPSAYHLGFILGPRINAAGRIDCADYGVRLLTTTDAQEAQALAQKLDIFNTERRAIEQEVLAAAMAQAEQQHTQPVIIVHAQGWHPGVIGIVAGRIKERFHRPTLVISFDDNNMGKGSGRSVTGIDLGSTIHAAKQMNLLQAGGGHAMAAGLTIQRDQLDNFCQFMCGRMVKDNHDFTPTVSFDSHIAASALTLEFVEKMAQLEPYGQGNPTPRFVINNLRLAMVDIVGTDHLRLNFQSMDGVRLKGIMFRGVDLPSGQYLLTRPAQLLDVLAAVKVDRWQGQETVKLEVDDIRPSRA